MSDHNLVHHEINYIEFAALDLVATKQFYTAAFGWTFNDYGPAYAGIRRLSGEGECGGFWQAEQVSTGGPLVVLYSVSLEDSAERVVAAGGKITKPIFAFPGGRRFHFADPSGNELAVWSDQP